MKNKKLEHIKTTGFKTPKNYFEGLDDSILNQAKLSSKIDTNGFKAPGSYFENLDVKLLDAVKTQPETKVIKLFNWKKAASVAAIAACMVLAFNLFFGSEDQISFDDLELTSIESYISEEDFTNEDFASLVTNDDISIYDFSELSITENTLENYIIENTTVEDLITD